MRTFPLTSPSENGSQEGYTAPSLAGWTDCPEKTTPDHEEGHSEGPVHNEPNCNDYEFLYGPKNVFMDETAETHYLVWTKSSSAALKENHRSEEGVKYSPATRELAARLKRRKADVLRELSETSSIRSQTPVVVLPNQVLRSQTTVVQPKPV